MHTTLGDIESSELIRFAEQYSSLGDAIQEQLKAWVADQDDRPTQGAYDYISDRLRGFSDELDELIESWYD